MELLLSGKEVAKEISNNFEMRIKKLKKTPCLAVLGLNINDESLAYIKKIEKNCKKYGINFILKSAKTEKEFVKFLEEVNQNDDITGIMCQQPIPKDLHKFLDTIPIEKDVEGITHLSLGRLFTGEKNVNIPCTSNAVIKTLDYYNIDLIGKNVVICGRSNIVGKPLIPQFLNKNATVTITHSKTKNIEEILKKADVIVIAIVKAKFLKKEMIKDGAILLDVGINFEDGKICGDIDFDEVKEKAYAITPVPGGIGVVTNSLLIENIISSLERQENN